MKNLIIRTGTGAVFVAAIIGAILWHPYAFGALFLIVTVLGLWEFYALVGHGGVQPQKITGLVLGIVFFCLSSPDAIAFLPFWGVSVTLSLPALIFTVFIVELFRKTEKPFRNIAYTVLGVAYVALPFIMLNSIASSAGHRLLLLGFFLLIWTNDTFAYLVGSLTGKHKLFERVSPKKTWEGTIGGAVLCFFGAYIISAYFVDYTLTGWLVMAGICAVFGTMGDLVQSRLKRQFGVKDSGTLLPGHGGVLDRFDGVLLAAPFFYAYVTLFMSS